MTTDFAYKLGQLYRALFDAVFPEGGHELYYQRALIHPLSEISLLILRAHQLRVMAPRLNLCVGTVLQDVTLEDMQDQTPFPVSLRGSFQLGYYHGPDGLIDDVRGVRAARIRSGYSIRGLAEAVGCSSTTIQDIELGHKVPRVDTLRKIAVVLGCSLDSLWP